MFIANIGGFAERRGTSRFPLREEVKYKVLHGKAQIRSASGKTLNIGSGGILFTTEERLADGPDGGTLGELAGAAGWHLRAAIRRDRRVVRSEDDRAAVRIERYEFRTRGDALQN